MPLGTELILEVTNKMGFLTLNSLNSFIYYLYCSYFWSLSIIFMD